MGDCHREIEIGICRVGAGCYSPARISSHLTEAHEQENKTMSEDNTCDNAEDQSTGIFSWHELHSADTDGSAKFYTQLLGWTTNSMDMGGGNIYTMFMNGERPVAGMINPPSRKGDVPTAWANYITVKDLDATVAKAQELGAKLSMPPMAIPGKGRFAAFTDPQGAMIAFWEFEK